LLSISIIQTAPVQAESYTIELGETFYYENCWTKVGTSARLERKVAGKSTWKQVSRSKPVRSADCDSGYKLVSYKWKPKTLGRHRLRESLPRSYGSKRTYSKAFTLVVVNPSFANSPAVSNTTLPSMGVTTAPPPISITTLPPALEIGGGVSSGSVSLTSSWSEFFQRYSITGSAGGSLVSLTSSWSEFFQRYSISGDGPPVISALTAAISVKIR